MRHNDVIELLSTTIIDDDLGNQIEKEEPRQVFANRMRVTTKERYEAGNQGLKPSKRFEMYSFEYNGETKLKYENVIYHIVDVDERGEKVHLLCEKDVGS